MKHPTKRLIANAVIAGLLTGLSWSNAVAQIATSPIILCHPETQVIKQNRKVTFTVRAKNPSLVHQTLTYQWQKRGPGLTNFENINGATSNTFKIAHVTTNDVAYYRVNVTGSSYTNATTTSEPAQLLVFTKNSPLAVYGSPVVESGSSDSCPGGYAGYVYYDKGSAWGWAGYHGLGNTLHKATDNNRNDTKVEPYGDYDDLLCATKTVSVPHPGPPPGPTKEDNLHQFTVYFPTGTSVPTTSYPITLDGFN